ncbi:4-hydroxybenzoate--CoA ligase [Chromatiales bacterium (ex Bugula neritina AB1)]|nr:4-hydroxybenzoate--CoA ligase [Chromatiales bacterium (ex Bugula neritina AB1)]
MADNNGNAAAYFVERHRTTSYADKAVFIEGDGKNRQLSYAELATESDKLADLYQRCGVRREQRAALLLLDTIEYPVIFWGSLKAGVIPIALNTLLATEVYQSILADSRATVLFVSQPLLDVIAPALSRCPELQHVFVVGDEKSEHHSYASEIASCQPTAMLNVSPDETAFWLYSSGSTGKPKGVRHSHSSMQFTAETYGRQVLGIEHDDTLFSIAKIFFAYGLGNTMTFPMSVGATAVLMSGRPTPDAVLSIINQQKPSIFCGVPTFYAALVAHLESHPEKIDTPLRRCISAGEALPENVGNGWQAITGCEILDGVGSTEMLHIFLSNQAGDVQYGTSGFAVPGYEIRLVDEHGAEVSVGEVGELLVNGASAASDYWNQRDKSRATFEGIWTRTGDKYEKAADGRMIYCGRTDDMFKVSGIWVSPFEVEQALGSHENVLEAAVVPALDDQQLEKPKAFVVLKNAVDEAATEALKDELKAHVQEQIGKWKYPRWIELVADLPKTATGKIQRFKLRD